MKSTGIVRRIDDLGRIVIPRDIRRTLEIREGEPLEIFIIDGGVTLKKYDPSISINFDQISEYYDMVFSYMTEQERQEFNEATKRMKKIVDTLGKK